MPKNNATAITTPGTPSFAISYGFMGGPAHSRQLRKLLRQTGFRQVPIAEADIILAHSAGCWLIPQTAQPKLVIYIGMPLAMARLPRTWMRANITSLAQGRLKHQLNTRFKNTYYGLRQPKRTLTIIRHPKIGQPALFPAAQGLFIANRSDPWPQAPLLEDFLATKPWSFVSLPGSHENIWEEPATYIAIISHYAALLAQTDQ